MENFWGQVKETTTRIVKNVTKKIVKVILPVVVIAGVLFTLLSGCTYEVTKQDAGYQEGNPANVPYAVSQFMSNITIDAEGNITSSQTVGELWNYLVLNNSKIEQYLNGPEDLLKLINAELFRYLHKSIPSFRF